jgi:hypothetical protein
MPQSVIITTDTNLLPYITTRNRNNTLHISPDRRIIPSEQVRVTISLPEIRALNLSDRTTAEVTDVESERLNLTLKDTSRLDISGRVNELELHATGAVDINGANLQTERAQVNLSGASEAIIFVTDQLDAAITDSAELRYRGNPSVSDNISGAGNIERIE